MSIKLGLMKGIREEQEKQQEQQELREKYSVKENTENIMIVEKSNMGKFFVRTIATVIRLFFRIISVFFSFIGLAAIVYPVPRNALYEIGLNAIREILSLFG